MNATPADLLEARRAALAVTSPRLFRVPGITCLWHPTASSAPDRLTLATALLAGTGHEITESPAPRGGAEA